MPRIVPGPRAAAARRTCDRSDGPRTSTIAAIAPAVRAGKLRAREVADAYLERIAREDAALGCYVRVDAEGARRTADAVDAAVKAGRDPGPLAGVPLGIKDIFCTKGVETTCASKILRGFVPPYESTVTARLAGAGAVSLGKLNMDEFAMGSSNENSAVGPVKNPWSLAHVPGGSSGGSAAAVAASLCVGATGTDTGGSIRQPAALCGVVGIKPTYGRVSRYGVVAFASSLDHPGPFARTVEDTATLLEVMAGPDPHDATSVPQPVGALRQGGARRARGPGRRARRRPRRVLRRRHGRRGRGGRARRARRARARGREARAGLAAAHELRHRRLLHHVHGRGVVEPGALRRRAVRPARGRPRSLEELYARTRGEGFGPEVKRRIMLGTYALRAGYYDAYYGKALRARRKIADDFAAAFTPVRRARDADVARARRSARRAHGRPAADVPRRRAHHRAEPGGHPGAGAAVRLHRRACRSGSSSSARRSARRPASASPARTRRAPSGTCDGRRTWEVPA